MRESIQRLYTAFDAVFPRPTAFDNEGCCVKDEHEAPLLTLPREDLPIEILVMPVQHACGCFGTLEQMSYFVPRIVELLDENEDFYEYGLGFFSLVRGHEQEYRSFEVWDQLEDSLMDVFRAHTEQFAVMHFDAAACQAKGWTNWEHDDIVDGVDLIDDMLREFFHPVLSSRRVTVDTGVALCTQWDGFFASWADETNPARLAHLLDILKRYYEDRIYGYSIPDSFVERIRDWDYVESLIERAMPALSLVDSPTYVNDLRARVLPST